jgi:hypothetical protein
MPPKLATFCAINKSFDWRISYHGGPKVEHFVVMATCVEELMDQMLNTCKKSCAITTWLILCNQHSFDWHLMFLHNGSTLFLRGTIAAT